MKKQVNYIEIAKETVILTAAVASGTLLLIVGGDAEPAHIARA